MQTALSGSQTAAINPFHEPADRQDLLAKLAPRLVLIETPADTADLLRAASPGRAKGFALLVHERACENGGLDQADFWQQVVALLSSKD